MTNRPSIDISALTTGSLSAAEADATPIRLLLVEDNQDDIFLTKRAFRVAAPHVAIEAVRRGDEAVEKANAGEYDVAVVDYQLPNLSGMEVLSSLTGLDIPIIMVTGKGDERVAVQALKSGASDYLVKDEGYLMRLPQATLGAVERDRLGKENRKLIAQTARQASLLEAVLDTDPGAIAVFRGPRLLLEMSNKGFRDLIPGLEESQAIGKTVDEVIEGYANPMLRKALDDVYKTGQPFHSKDISFLQEDGSERYYRFHMMILNADAPEDERGVVVTIWDTSEVMLASRKIEELAEQAEAQRDWLRAVVDQMPLGVHIADSNFETILMNRVALEMFCGDWENKVGPEAATDYTITNPDGALVQPEDLPMVRALANEETIIGRQLRVENPNGHVMDVLINARPIYDNKGKLTAAIKVAQDITNLKDIDRMKDEFISIAGHELRTPLTNVRAAAQLLAKQAKQSAYTPQQTSFITTIVQQAERMARLIEELLDVSRLESGKLRMHPQPFDLSALGLEVVEHCRLSYPQCDFELHAQGNVSVTADRDRIAQVLSNLLENAFRHGARGGKGHAELFITANPSEKLARIEVRDDGIGFDASQGEQIFERFSRLGSVTHHSRGLGLGLFICRQIVTAHGGEITAHSPGPGQGATFTVTLPRDA